MKTELLDELGRKIALVEKGKRRLMSHQTLIVKRLVAHAANGDGRAVEQVLRLITQIEVIQRVAEIKEND